MEAIRFVRRPGPSERHFDLTQDCAAKVLDGVDALIHLAWQWSMPGPNYRKANVSGARKLFDLAASRGIHVVLLSTFSAFTSRPSEYAECKRALEYDLHGGLGTSVRAGLIWGGGPPMAMIQTVLRLASVPAMCLHLAPDPVMFQTESEKLARLLVSTARGEDQGGVTLAAFPEPLSLSAIEHAARMRPARLHVPIPTALVQSVARTAERTHLPLPLRSDSFAGALRPRDVSNEVLSNFRFAAGFANNEGFLAWLRAQG